LGSVQKPNPRSPLISIQFGFGPANPDVRRFLSVVRRMPPPCDNRRQLPKERGKIGPPTRRAPGPGLNSFATQRLRRFTSPRQPPSLLFFTFAFFPFAPLRAVSLPFAFLSFSCLPLSAYCFQNSELQTVASFPITPMSSHLFSGKSVASFLKSHQLSAISLQKKSNRRRCKVEELRAGPWNLSAFDSSSRPATTWPPNGGFVPHHAKDQSFVIKQIGGFVFEKPSAISY